MFRLWAEARQRRPVAIVSGFLVALALAAGLTTPAAASPGPAASWTQKSPATVPPARAGAIMAYDAATNNVVLFSGGSATNDTWTWNGTNWNEQFPSASPPARYTGAGAYDAKTGTVVIFGGDDSSGNLNDTWTWNGATWTEQFPTTSPPAAHKAFMAYDAATQDVVLFDAGGTWLWNGSDWSEATPATSPSTREAVAIAYDPRMGEIVLFGGWNGSYLGDTWTWNGTTWTQLSPATSPPARYGANMVYDSNTGDLVLFDGRSATGEMNDTWVWNGTDWSEQFPSTSPPGREYSNMAWDSATGNAVLFGGEPTTSWSVSNDTWIYQAQPGPLASVTVSPSSATVGSGTGQAFTAQGYDAYGNMISGLTYTWSASAGTFSATTGPSVTWTAPSTAGSDTVTASATQSGTTETASAAVTVPPPPLAITTTIVYCVVDSTCDMPIHATGGVGSYTWSTTNAYVTMNPTTGVGVSYPPHYVANFPWAVTVTDASGTSVTKTVTLQTVPAPLNSVAISPTGATVAGTSSQAFTAQGYDQYGNAISGLTYSWSASGGTFASAIGASNTWTAPDVPGSATVTVSATQSGTTANASANVTVTPGPLTITSLSATCEANQPCDHTFTAIGGTAPYTWSTTAPVSLNASTGQVIGTAPDHVGAYHNTVTVTDSTGVSTSITFTLYVVPGPLYSVTITPTSATVPTGSTQTFSGQGYDNQGNAISGLTYSWSASGGTFATATGPSNTWTAPGSPGTATVTASATQSGTTATASASVSVPNGPLGIATIFLPAATAGTAYSATLSAYGGAPPYTWTVSSLPSGLAVNPSTGVISGTVDAAGTSTVSVQVTDSSAAAVTKSLSITVNPGPLASVKVSPAPATLMAGGGTQTFSVSAEDAYGNVIPGLTVDWTGTGGTLSASSGGSTVYTPGTAAGAFSITATATQGASTRSGSAAITINPGPVATVTVSPASATVLTGHTQAFSAQAADGYGNAISGDAFAWTAAGGSLSAASGTPVTYTAGATGGSYTVSATVNTKSGSAAVTVEPILSIGATSLPGGVVGHPYSASVTASGGVPPYAWSVASGALPPGLTLDPANGLIAGTPITTGTSTFTVAVTDRSLPAHQMAEHAYTMSVSEPLCVQTTSLQAGVQGDPYSANLAAIGGLSPYTWSLAAGTLPPGLSLNASGQISGTASAAGTYSFTVSVASGDGQAATKPFSVQVYPPLVISSSSLASATVDQAYSAFLTASGGTGQYVWSAVYGIPSGMGLSASGDLGGTPTTAGTYSLQVKVTDSVGDVATQTVAMTVNPAPVSGVMVTGMTPTSGPIGTTVTIDGANLTQARVVDFGASAGTSLRAQPSGTSLSVVAPAGTGSVPVKVVTVSQSVGAGTFTYS